MKTLISIDPGKSTGLLVGTYSDTEPFRVTHAFQIEGGVEGFLQKVRLSKWHDRLYDLYRAYLRVEQESFGLEEEVSVQCEHPDRPSCPDDDHPCNGDTELVRLADVIVEKFTARSVSAGGFAYRTDSLEPLRVEGAILALGIDPQWVSPPQQYFLGGKSKAEKMKNRNAWFRDHKDLGYYITGKDVGCKDSDDVRSALAHCIAYLRRQKHAPTLELFRKDEQND